LGFPCGRPLGPFAKLFLLAARDDQLWGFGRPDYAEGGNSRLVQNLPPGVPMLGTPATANDRVVEDVAEQLGTDLVISRGPLDILAAVDCPYRPNRSPNPTRPGVRLRLPRNAQYFDERARP